jgi:hypothetical protein
MPDKTRKRKKGGGKAKFGKKTIRSSIRKIQKAKSEYPEVLGKHLEKALLKLIHNYNITNDGKLQSEISVLSSLIIGQVYKDMTPEKIKDIKNNDDIGKLLNVFGTMKIHTNNSNNSNNNSNNSNNSTNNSNINLEELNENAIEDPVGSLYTLTQIIHKLIKKYIKEKNEEKSNRYGLFIIFLAEAIQKGIDEYEKPVDNSSMNELLSSLGRVAL